MRRLTSVSVIVLGLVTVSFAGDWTVHTNVQSVRRLLVDSGYAYAVTGGGLLVHADAPDLSYRIYNSGDGLGSHDLSGAVRVADTFWLGGTNAVLTRFHPASGAVQRFPLALGIGRIDALLSQGDTLWLGTDIGIGLFLKDVGGGLLKEVYTRLDLLPAEAAVVDLILYADRLWAATVSGLVSADPQSPTLHIAGSWTGQSDPEGALATTRRLGIFRDSLFAATDSGLFVLEDTAFAPRFTGYRVRDIHPESDTLWVASDSGVFIYTATGVAHHPAANLVDVQIDNIARVPGGDLWVSLGPVSLYHYGSAGPWFADVPLNQPPGREFPSLVAAGGLVWAAQRDRGAAYLDAAGTWARVTAIVESPGAPTTGVRASTEAVYFAGFGQGLHVVDLPVTGNDLQVTHWLSTNSSLAAVVDSYTVVADVAVDAAGGFWAANRFTGNGQSLVYFAPDTSQIVYGTDDGLAGNDMNVLMLQGNRLWIGYNGAGLGVLEFNGTPANKQDDAFRLFTQNQDRLPGDIITSLALDATGRIWVGTPGGLARIDPEFYPFISVDFASVEPASGDIRALAIDAGNRLWVGTGDGLARLPGGSLAADSIWRSGSSALPDNQVLSLAFDPAASRLWVGTANGLAEQTLAVRVQAEIPNVYPNPLRIRYSGDFATFEVPAGTRVDIFTVAGDRVRSLVSPYEWKGDNDAGQPVASGLYLFRATYPDGTVGQGRLGLVRER